MKHIGLFEGIGGFSLAARWMGWETIAWCEWNEFGQKVLKHHFPKATPHGDITKTDFTIYAGKCDILTGGFPCQPYSQAGKRLGKEDNRHLWPEMLRAIREIQPGWVVGENVRGLTNWNGGVVFDEVQADLEAEGYEVLPFLLPACAVNAPHRRDRIWFVAYNNSFRQRNGCEQHESDKQGHDFRSNIEGDAANTNSIRFNDGISQHEINTSEGGEYAQRNIEQMGGYVADTKPKGSQGAFNNSEFSKGLQSESTKCNNGDATHTDLSGCKTEREQSESTTQGSGVSDMCGGWDRFPTQPPICSRDDGLPGGLDGITFSKWRNESIKAYGNAIVPQVAYQIFKAIAEYNKARVKTQAVPLNDCLRENQS